MKKLLGVARQRWIALTAFAVLGLLVGVGVATLSPRLYSSTVTMYISASNTNNATTAYQGGLLSEQRVTSYVQLLTGGRIAQEVANRSNLGLSPEEVSEKISANALPDSVIVTATVTDDSPQRATQLADTVGTVFVNLVAELEQPQDRSQPPSVVARVVQGADFSADPVSPRPFVDVTGGLLAGLAVGLAVIVLLDAADRSVRSTEQLEREVEAPVLTTVPLVRADQGGRLNLIEGPESEAFRRLRANLQFIPFESSRGQVISISSSVAGEGKTTTVVNLGAVLAQAGRRVVLVDADLRKPTLGQRLGVDVSIGLTTVLTGRASAMDVVAVTDLDGLRIIPSGPIPPNPSELLETERMRSMLDELSRHYEYVIVDTPPLVPVIDGAVVADLTDGVVLIVRHGSTRTDQVAASVGALRSASARLVGCVLSMAPAQSRRGYGYYHGYGYPEKLGHSLDHEGWGRLDEPGESAMAGANASRPSPAPRR